MARRIASRVEWRAAEPLERYFFKLTEEPPTHLIDTSLKVAPYSQFSHFFENYRQLFPCRVNIFVCAKTSFGDSSISSGFTPSLIHVSARICSCFVVVLTLCLAVHKLLSISKELRRLVGSETWYNYIDKQGMVRGFDELWKGFAFLVHCATGFRMNQLGRAHTLNFAVIVNVLQSSGFPERVLLVLTAIVIQTSASHNRSSIKNAPLSNTTRASSFQT